MTTARRVPAGRRVLPPCTGHDRHRARGHGRLPALGASDPPAASHQRRSYGDRAPTPAATEPYAARTRQRSAPPGPAAGIPGTCRPAPGPAVLLAVAQAPVSTAGGRLALARDLGGRRVGHLTGPGHALER